MNPTDTTAVNPASPTKRVPTLFPDPMNPHSLYNPNLDPKEPDDSELDEGTSRR